MYIRKLARSELGIYIMVKGSNELLLYIIYNSLEGSNRASSRSRGVLLSLTGNKGKMDTLWVAKVYAHTRYDTRIPIRIPIRYDTPLYTHTHTIHTE